jgi:hypothetical protein
MCHADGQTDTRKLTVDFRNFAKVPQYGEKKRILMGITMSPLLELISKTSRQPNVSGVLITRQIDLKWQFLVFAS